MSNRALVLLQSTQEPDMNLGSAVPVEALHVSSRSRQKVIKSSVPTYDGWRSRNGAFIGLCSRADLIRGGGLQTRSLRCSRTYSYTGDHIMIRRKLTVGGGFVGVCQSPELPPARVANSSKIYQIKRLKSPNAALTVDIYSGIGLEVTKSAIGLLQDKGTTLPTNRCADCLHATTFRG